MMNKSQPKSFIGFTIHVRPNGSFRHLQLDVRRFHLRDAASEIREAVRSGNKSQQEQLLKLANKLQTETGDTKYGYDIGSRGRVVYEWQDDKESGADNWYGGSVSFDDDQYCSSLFAKISKKVGHSRDLKPREFVEALVNKLRAKPVSYLSGEWVWGINGAFNLDAEIPAYVQPQVKVAGDADSATVAA